MKPQLLCPFLQGEAERTSPGEAETGGEDHGPVQGSGPQHAPASQQGQVMFTHTHADPTPRPRELRMQLYGEEVDAGTSRGDDVIIPKRG